MGSPACPQVQATHKPLEVPAADPKSPDYFQYQWIMQHHPRREASEVLAAALRASLYKSMAAQYQRTVRHTRNHLLRSTRITKNPELSSSEFMSATLCHHFCCCDRLLCPLWWC